MKKILALIFSLAQFSWATIAFDNSTSAHATSGSSQTISFTVNSNTNGILVVGTGFFAATNVTVTGVTAFKGGSATALTFIRADGTGTTMRSELWYILTPDTGAHNVVVSFSAAVSDVITGIVSMTGVSQASPIDANNGSTSTSGNISTTITTVNDNAAIMDACGWNIDDSTTMTAVTNRVQRWNVSDGNVHLGSGSTLINLVAHGAQAMAWTQGGSTQIAQSVASFVPAGAGSSPSGVNMRLKKERLDE